MVLALDNERDRFAELEIGAFSIEVADNGHGMSLETIRDTWLEPGTLYRKKAIRSEGRGRRVLGEKGLGRFAASRLASRLELVTRRAGARDEVHVELDWSRFDDESRYLDEVEARWWTLSSVDLTTQGMLGRLARALEQPVSGEHGTLLRVWPLRTTWNEEKVRDVRSTLSRLVLPTSDRAAIESDFGIFLDLPEPLTELGGLVEQPESLGQPHYSVTGTVVGDGKYTLKMTLRGVVGGDGRGAPTDSTIRNEPRLGRCRCPGLEDR